MRMDRLCAGLSVAVVANLFAQFPALLGEVPPDEVAVVLGSMMGCKTDEEYYRSFLNASRVLACLLRHCRRRQMESYRSCIDCVDPV